MNSLSPFWSQPPTELLQQLESSPQGLTRDQAQARLARLGRNLLRTHKRTHALALLIHQFSNPITLILLFAAALAFVLEDRTDTLIILAIVAASGVLGFWQEYGAADAVEKLLALVQIKVSALRDRSPQEIPTEEIVPGDVILLSAGATLPGDCAILEAKDLFVDEAALTGETYPVAKSTDVLPADTPLAQRTNALFMGTHVISGRAKALVVRTGRQTEFGKVSERLATAPPETEFERGIRRFGYLVMEVTLFLVIAIFAINVFLERPVLDAFLFALALAVGLTPQLLPAIISINLARGAKRMAQNKVIVKRLAAIENFGSMNILCSDKTGTLTEGVVHIRCALDLDGKESDRVFLYAYLNAQFETGFTNPIDAAICAHRPIDVSAYRKLDEVPYDFIRKRLSILVEKDGKHILITKGAVKQVLSICSRADKPDGSSLEIAKVKAGIEQLHEEYGRQGFRTLGIAYRDIGGDSQISEAHEAQMTFLGLLVLFDPPKPGIQETLSELNRLGVSLKIITGDNRLVAANLSQQVGLAHSPVLTGGEIRTMSDEALIHRVNNVDIFAEIEPNQKERILLAVKKAGNVVGFIGDGINDGSALHAADVGISVDSAVDVAKEAADIVLLEHDLGVLVQGVREGRTTFANTLKYVFMATSANFGNMFSMAGASLFLSFLPLLPKQILLTNLLTDLPEMTIATDSVDRELVEQPRRWDIRFIRNFMVMFGLLSSIFDYLTFAVLLWLLHAGEIEFRTGWFMESVLSASMIVLIIRTRRPFFRSKPGNHLLIATFLVAIGTLLLPLTPLAGILGFTPLPFAFLFALIVILILYISLAEAAKWIFYRRFA